MYLIKISIFTNIFCCYQFKSISSCRGSGSVNKLVTFISPYHVIFYKKLLKILKGYQVDFFCSVFMYLQVTFSGSFINFKFLFSKLILFGNSTAIVWSIFDKFFFLVALIKLEKASIFFIVIHFAMFSCLNLRSRFDRKYSSPPINFSFFALLFFDISFVKLFSLSKSDSLWYMKFFFFF